jgi:hypothetical protein
MSPRTGSLRPLIAGERLTEKQRRALLIIDAAGNIDDEQLKKLTGAYARNVIDSLHARGLIRRFALSRPGPRAWTLNRRGRRILPALRQFADGS